MSKERLGYNFTRVVTATTTTPTGALCLKRITVNTSVANAVITIYDNTAASGTVIAIITMPAAILQNHFDIEYDIKLTTGLTVVSSSTADFTIVWA